MTKSDSEPHTFSQYIADMATARLNRLVENAERLDPDNPEQCAQAVHQMRVWARRTRAALDIIESQFDAPELTQLSAVLKTCAAELGVVRDIDVICESLHVAAASLPEHQRGGIKAITTRLLAQRTTHLPALFAAAERLRSPQTQQLLAQWKTRVVPPKLAEATEE